MKVIKMDYSQADDIMSSKATYALAGSLVVGLVFWATAIALIF